MLGAVIPRPVENVPVPLPVHTTPVGPILFGGMSTLLPRRIQDPNRLSPLKTFVYSVPLEQHDTPLTGLLIKVQTALASRGIAKLSSLVRYALAEQQIWLGGRFLSPTNLTTTVLTNIDEFWVAADEIVIEKSLNATIRVSGTVMLVANKVTVEPGAQLDWSPPSPFSLNQFDWKNSNGVDIRAADGANGGPGAGRTWSNSAPPADKAGHPGGNGASGQPGNAGPAAPSIIIVAKEINTLPIIRLAGFRGGAGQDGGSGGNGGAGDKGEPAQTNWTGANSRGCGYGGNGGAGGNAGRGGFGGAGGDGGDVVIYCLETTKDVLTAQPVNISLQPGPGGNGGAPGAPGRGGPGGPHGDRHGWGEMDDTYRNGSTGNPGLADQTPPAQLRGPDGIFHGCLTFNVVTEAQLPSQIITPAIVSFVPNSGRPGDTIVLHAVNVPPGTQVSLNGVRLAAVSWTANANTFTTTFKIPEDAAGGMARIALVDGAGNVTIGVPETLLVLPRLDAVVGEARFGGTLSLAGAGFSSTARVMYGGHILNAQCLDHQRLSVTIPSPVGAFEQQAGNVFIAVMNEGGYQSNQCTVSLDHWLHLGFDPNRDSLPFNNAGKLVERYVSVDLDLFTQTFGQDDREILAPDNPAAVQADLADPANAVAGWVFFGIYKAFLNSDPGLCTGFSAYALDYFFSGGPPLCGLNLSFTGKIARDIAALQGRVTSRQQLEMGIEAIQANSASNDHTGSTAMIQRLESSIRHIVQAKTLDNRKQYPLLGFVPRYEGITDTSDFFNRINEGHTILPYAIRYPRADESFLARIYCCNNWNYRNNFVRVTIQRDYSFTTEQFDGPAGTEYDRSATYKPLANGGKILYQSADGWGIVAISMSAAFYDNVDMPTNVFTYLSPVTVALDDGKGHKIGEQTGDLYAHAQIMAPSPFVKGMFRPRSTASVWIAPKQGSVICSIPGVEPLKMGRIYLAA
jgi:hypothetical protein